MSPSMKESPKTAMRTGRPPCGSASRRQNRRKAPSGSVSKFSMGVNVFSSRAVSADGASAGRGSTGDHSKVICGALRRESSGGTAVPATGAVVIAGIVAAGPVSASPASSRSTTRLKSLVNSSSRAGRRSLFSACLSLNVMRSDRILARRNATPQIVCGGMKATAACQLRRV